MTDAFFRCQNPPLFAGSIRHCSIVVGAGAHDWEQAFAVSLPAELAGCVTKRRRDYLAGRYCARQALALLDPKLAGKRVEIGPNREPLWPHGVVGSITHTGGFAAAAVALAAEIGGVGIDAEHVLDQARALEIERLVLLDAERRHVASTGLEHHELVSLVFSAKEAVFKCLYALGRELWDFTELELTRVDRHSQSFTIEPVSQRARAAWPREPLACSYVLAGDYVHTGCVLARGS